MRLKHIKIAGFKSFVDPTTLVLPENMTCIVGPNGCGKSNTIDAVRWVMGESSAKQLRGDSSTDVIFAGSTSRKPVSQASVELLFDNTENKCVGEYAQYAEIAVKRLVNRDGQSHYFLNNTKCRKRDVTALFLGTGLGPRSYAIIEQGMISNLITAKPEDLRIFLEEAAGISKYKERRKETELRIRRTRENLERLFDIRDELGRQLKRLEKQAADAQAYKILQADKRQKQAELAFIRMSKVQDKKKQLDDIVKREEINLEATYAQRREVELTIEKMRSTIEQAQESFYEKQQAFYSVGTAITQLEEAQKHQQGHQQRLCVEKQQLLQSFEILQKHETEDRERQEQLQIELDESEPELEILDGRIEAAQERLEQAQEALTQWQDQWHAYVIGSALPREKSQVIQVKIQQHEKVMTQLKARHEQLESELTDLKNAEETSQIKSFQAQKQVLKLKVKESKLLKVQAQELFRELQSELTIRAGDASTRQATLDQAQGRLVSLIDIQKKALQSNDTDQTNWLQVHKLESAPMLVHYLDVQREWQLAVEKLLGPLLTGRLVSNEVIKCSIVEQSPYMMYLLTEQHESATTVVPFVRSLSTVALQPLVSVIDVQGEFVLPGWLQGVFIASHIEEALGCVDQLSPFESILTQQGHWLGAGWACIGQNDSLGILVLQQDVDDLTQQIESFQISVAQGQSSLQRLQSQIQEQQQVIDEIQNELHASQSEASIIAQDLSGLEAKVEQVTLRRQRIEQEISDGVSQYNTEVKLMQQCRQALEGAVESMAIFEDERIRLEDQQEERQQSVRLCQESLTQDQDRARVLVESVKFASSAVETIDRQIERITIQVTQQQQRLQQIEQELAQTRVDQVAIDRLPALLESRVEAQTMMDQAKDILETQRQYQIQQERIKSDTEGTIDTLRTELEAARIQVQAQLSDLAHIRAELQDYKLNEEDLASLIPAQAQEKIWRRAIVELEDQVVALGAINLAAVDEFQSQSERKIYMDEQYADLESALFTLEEAIEQIDQETRERFLVTFSQVNEGMSTLFPQLFGGGQAKLQLIGDDILTAGVAIMAQPPGKKNTSIHMLSGGEKALTAISLVFAIFQLNPSPFCMLDEVDAPLDDANVGRYADMVKHMSQTVQFIYISHNKIAMEKAEHLMGVTMQEPGVSRLVSVDMSEASSLIAM